MNDPSPPRTVVSIDGHSVAEIAVVAVGATALIVAATLTALAAAATVDDSSRAAAVALLVGLATTGTGLAGARLLRERLETAVDRRFGRRSEPPLTSAQ
ncbi:hypothetical protein [Halopiger aswanensis]|uniref:Uncharacterized protein n=1 Tax=Halopiger aswanensis TaxID=148449 RepID=A0A419WK84_9EURY|nr:hypothetical protein [Halopiger aswanensis]RKD95878.1 hypothetical protein ATJ93_2741 [Halopiger aswanensis]